MYHINFSSCIFIIDADYFFFADSCVQCNVQYMIIQQCVVYNIQCTAHIAQYIADNKIGNLKI